MSISYLRYLHTAQDILKQIEATQTDAIAQASDMCAETIAEDGLVYLFGSGHSRMAVEEIFPRYGSFPGFFPIVELASHVSQSSRRLQRSTPSTFSGKYLRICRSDLTQFHFRASRLHDGIF